MMTHISVAMLNYLIYTCKNTLGINGNLDNTAADLRSSALNIKLTYAAYFSHKKHRLNIVIHVWQTNPRELIIQNFL